jgi:hypothetical protein
MDIVINTTSIDRFFALPSDQMVGVFFGNFGWLVLALVFLLGVKEVYLFWLRDQWEATHKSVLLAIDIPKGNEQSPKAVENMFTYLAGAHGSINFFEKWFQGMFQKSFSYEVVSLEGYTQFLIRTPAEFRNLIESSVYSQYPDAEISEVDDYTETVPRRWPDEEYDIWGTEFMQAASGVYPIKLYRDFEHQMGPSETQFKDPMATLMDLCGSLRQGEQLWYQIIVIPIGFDWVKNSEKEVNKIMGRKSKSKNNNIAIKTLEAIGEASESIYSIWGDIDSKQKEERQRTMMDLTPGEKRKVEGIHEKSAKLAFEAKIRMVYVAKKEIMNMAKVANGIVGYMKQFAALDLNNLKPDVNKTMTKTMYFMKKFRLLVKQRNIFNAYIKRSDNRGRKPGLFNIEELATLWHFPVEANVKSPLIQKAPGRKADAPSSLPLAAELTTPTEDFFKNSFFTNQFRTAGQVASGSESVPDRGASAHRSHNPEQAWEDLSHKDAAPPANLPTI